MAKHEDIRPTQLAGRGREVHSQNGWTEAFTGVYKNNKHTLQELKSMYTAVNLVDNGANVL